MRREMDPVPFTVIRHILVVSESGVKIENKCCFVHSLYICTPRSSSLFPFCTITPAGLELFPTATFLSR